MGDIKINNITSSKIWLVDLENMVDIYSIVFMELN
jgi:hypothetical protein